MGNCLCGGGGGDAGAAAAAREMLAPAGLGAYAGTLARAGFDRREALAGLCEADLRAVEAFSGQAIPPGHRKGILQAARRYAAGDADAFGAQRDSSGCFYRPRREPSFTLKSNATCTSDVLQFLGKHRE